MRQSLQLRTSLQLTMTPQLQQAIRLLQLSSLELQTEIQTVLESNFMLEQAEEAESPPAPAQAETIDEKPHSSEVELNTSNTDKAPDELPVDSNWDDVYESYDGATSYSRNDDDSDFAYDQNMSTSQSLHDYLTWQMELTPFS